MTIGNTIAYYRKKLNITQDTLARQLEVTNQAVSKWESDQCCPDIALLPRLADIFGITIDELFGRKPKSRTVCDDLPWRDDGTLRVVLYVGHTLVVDGSARDGFAYTYEAGVEGVESAVSIQCGDVDGDVNVSGNVTCGNVDGDVDAGGSVTCGGVDGDVDAGGSVVCVNVAGSVDAGSSVTCCNVEGDVDAGAGVECGDVSGDVDAGTEVRCGAVGGDVDAGSNVYCGDVGGDVDAGGSVTMQK